MRQKELEETELHTTVERIEEVLADAPGRTAKQIEVSKVDILKKQRQPGKRIVITVKGRKKTSEQLLQELVPLVEKAEIAQKHGSFGGGKHSETQVER